MPPQGGGRIDNPASYSTLYLSDAPAGAIAEAFGRFPEWSPAILRGRPDMPGSVQAVARYELAEPERICDLDNVAQLRDLKLRPSDIVTRDYSVSRAWALEIFRKKKWIGVRWWSYYDPRWSSFGLWDVRKLKLQEVAPLRIDSPALREAAITIARTIRTRVSQ